MTELETRISEVATWILKVNPQFEDNYFRSEEIQPFHKLPTVQRLPICDVATLSLGVQKRRALLKEKNIALITLEEAATYGTLVYTLPQESHLDDGAELYSQGLVDIWEVPAWDTWVTFGTSEFKEFKEYPNAVISWIPKTLANLFYSGLSVSIIDNLGWVKLDLPDAFLSHLTIKPRCLEFIEIAEQDKAAIISRLRLINGVDYDAPITNTSEEIAPAKLPSNNFLNKLKAWFS